MEQVRDPLAMLLGGLVIWGITFLIILAVLRPLVIRYFGFNHLKDISEKLDKITEKFKLNG